jgi:hypothetical protein
MFKLSSQHGKQKYFTPLCKEERETKLIQDSKELKK